MDDIVTRLRAAYKSNPMGFGDHWNLHDEAADEIERLREDAERYRRLGWLVAGEKWLVQREGIYMIDKAHMDRTLDDPMAIAEAEECRAALEKHSVTEEK